MALKPVLTSLDGLEPAIAALYKKSADDGKFYLEAEGLVDKAKLDTFRENNIALQKQLDEIKAQMEKFAGVDPDKYKAAMDAIESDKEKKLLKDGKIDEVIALRTEKMRQTYEDKIAAKDVAINKAIEEAKKAGTERDTYIVAEELRKAVDNPELGFHNGVADTLKPQVLKEFQYRDGKVIRVKADGTPAFGAKGDPATISEYLQDMVKEHPYLVKASTGGGARNNGAGGGDKGGSKTMKRSEFDAISDPAKKAEVARGGYTFVD